MDILENIEDFMEVENIINVEMMRRMRMEKLGNSNN